MGKPTLQKDLVQVRRVLELKVIKSVSIQTLDIRIIYKPLSPFKGDGNAII